MNYEPDSENAERERERESNKAYHKKRFIIYIVLWILSGIVTGIISGLSALKEVSSGVVTEVPKMPTGTLICLTIGSIASLVFLVLWIYHLVKWVSVK